MPATQPCLGRVAAHAAQVCGVEIKAIAPDEDGFVEEGEQRVGNPFWQEAHGADVPKYLSQLAIPSYLVFGTADEYVSAENRELSSKDAPRRFESTFLMATRIAPYQPNKPTTSSTAVSLFRKQHL